VFGFEGLFEGILLVFDNTNSISYSNLKKWIRELVEVNRVHPLEESYRKAGHDPGLPTEELDAKLGELPVICVGTKCTSKVGAQENTRAQQVLKNYGIECSFVVRQTFEGIAWI
jgi:GTPase SAR1 family protein